MFDSLSFWYLFDSSISLLLISVLILCASMKSPQETAWSYWCFRWKSSLSGELLRGSAISICCRYLSLITKLLLFPGWICPSSCWSALQTRFLFSSCAHPTPSIVLVFSLRSSWLVLQSVSLVIYGQSLSLLDLVSLSLSDFVLGLDYFLFGSLGFDVLSVSGFLDYELVECFAACVSEYMMFSSCGQCSSLMGRYSIAESLKSLIIIISNRSINSGTSFITNIWYILGTIVRISFSKVVLVKCIKFKYECHSS